MAIQDDFTLDYTAKTIAHTSGSTRYSVNALYSWLMDLFDDAGQMDDSVPMSAQTPTEYSLINGWTFAADSDLGYLFGGAIRVLEDDDTWANYYTIGTIESDAVVYWQQNGVLVASHPGYVSGHIDQLIKVRAAGVDVASRNVTAYIRNNASGNADLYDHFTAQAPTTGGRNPIPLASAPDTNDDGGGAGVSGVTITFGATSQDIGDGSGAQPYDVIIDGGGNSCQQVYRRLKYLTRRENTSAVGTGTSVQGRFYRSANAAYSEVKPAPFGSFAGGKIFGARGVWITNVNDPNNRQLLDASNVSRVPPVQFTFTVTGVQAGDRVLVARSTGSGSSTVDKDQFTLDGAHTSGMSTISVNEAVANDIPSAGVIRVLDVRYTYTAVDRPGKEFTISGTLGQSFSGGAAAYVPLIDDIASGTSVASPAMTYVADMDVVYRIRKKGILPFENTAVVGSAGASVSAIRTTDSVVT